MKDDFYSLEKRDLLFQDYRVNPKGNETREFILLFRSLGLLKEKENWREYYKIVTRILLNPKKEVINEIVEERFRLGDSENQIGAHVRCGGALADVNEEIAMITPEILKTVPDMIWKAANDSGIPRERLYLYLSTDSSIAAKAIADAMKPIPVKSASKYYRGHTETALVDNNALKRSLMELILTAESQSLIISSSSGFSLMIKWLAGLPKVTTIQAPYSYVDDVVFGKRIG